MKKTTTDLILLAGTGANLKIDATERTTADIIQIVGAIGLSNSHITICNAHSITTTDLLKIASVYPKSITFDFMQNDLVKK